MDSTVTMGNQGVYNYSIMLTYCKIMKEKLNVIEFKGFRSKMEEKFITINFDLQKMCNSIMNDLEERMRKLD